MSPTRLPQQPASPPLQAMVPRAAPARQPNLGEQIGKYQLLARLATGGMAELFVARLIGAAGFRKNVVIKRILPHVTHDANFTRMFVDEAITCAEITHPNVCQVFELCEVAESHFLVLEHLEGATVGDLMRRCTSAKRPVNIRLAAGILVQACDGLQAAHEQVDQHGRNVGLVHRDVSPGNLFITVDGIVKVLDFGIAKAKWMSRKTRTGTLLGKCEYMSPEQARGDGPVDRRSDVFSLGIIAWEMLCGRRLFRRESEYETLRAVLRDTIEPPSDLRNKVPHELSSVIMRALERDPDDRYSTAHEFRQAISDSLNSMGGPISMCEIAPIIRASFAEELRLQRALIKEATRRTEEHGIPALRTAPRGTLPGTQGEPRAEMQEDSTQPHARMEASLPSLSPTSTDESGSMELTFRVIPKTPAKAGKWVPRRPAKPTRDIRSGEATRESSEVAGTIEPSAPPELEIQSTPLRDQRKQGKQQLMLLAIVALLGAALAGTLASIYYGDGDRGPEASEKKLQNQGTAPAAPSAKLGAKAGAKKLTDQTAPKPAAKPVSAAAHERAQSKLLAANSGRAARVTSLLPEMGSITIRSSKPAIISLYPSKTIIGTTPLNDFELPEGEHKLKAQLGEGKGARKYFHITVKAGERSSRSLRNWKSKRKN